jgi:xylan 1,4-beta-xylosidase
MLGMMGGDRVAAQSTGAVPLETMLADGVKARADVGVLATRGERSIAAMIWHYHDDDLPAPPADIDLTISGIPAGRVHVKHYRVDGEHSNSYEMWKKMGSPQSPTEEQYSRLERSGQLEMLTSPEWQTMVKAQFLKKFAIPRQGVSMVLLTW